MDFRTWPRGPYDIKDVPLGFCHCGCGQRTTVPDADDRSKRWKKGRPLLFIIGHSGRPRRPDYQTEGRGYITACWVWLSGKSEYGYGRFRGKNAHRVMYELHLGPVPSGMELDHLCRQRDCVRPDHLEPVTHTENVRRGAQSKLSIESAVEIRRLAADCVPVRELAVRYGVTDGAIKHVIYRRQWL